MNPENLLYTKEHEWLKIDGEYTVLQRRRAISEKIDIGGKVNTRNLGIDERH